MTETLKPVAYAAFAENGNIRIWSQEPGRVERTAVVDGFKVEPLVRLSDAQSALAEKDRRIAELEKRLADADRVIEPFAAVEPMNVWHETEEDDGYHSLTENQFRAARAYMEGK